MSEILGQVYNDVANESLDELRSGIERNVEKYSLDVETDRAYD